FRAVCARADRLVREEIARAHADPAVGTRPDVLAMLIRHREPDGTALTVAEMRDQLVTLPVAGHQTTPHGLAWGLARRVPTPSALERATEAARSGDVAHLDAVVCETLRSRPVVPDVSRLLVRDFQLGEHLLPAGTYVDPAIVLVHRSPAVYQDPER